MAGRGTDIQLGGNLDKKLEGIDPIHKDNILQKHKEDKKSYKFWRIICYWNRKTRKSKN